MLRSSFGSTKTSGRGGETSCLWRQPPLDSEMTRYVVFLPPKIGKTLTKSGTPLSWTSTTVHVDIAHSDSATELDNTSGGAANEPVAQQQVDIEAPLHSMAISQTSSALWNEFLLPESQIVFSGEQVSHNYAGAIPNENKTREDAYHSQSRFTFRTTQTTENYEWSLTNKSRLLPSQMSGGGGDSVQSSLRAPFPPTSQTVPESRCPGTRRTQRTSFEESAETESQNVSDSSIMHLPTFHIPLRQLVKVSSLLEFCNEVGNDDPFAAGGSRTIPAVLVAIMDVDGPTTITLKKGLDAGKEVALLKLVLGDPEGGMIKLTAWRDAAERWGTEIRKGDVVLLQNLQLTHNAIENSTNLTASDNMRSQATVCYRTMPVVASDRRYRPDLRVAGFDKGVAKVKQVAEWIVQQAYNTGTI